MKFRGRSVLIALSAVALITQLAPSGVQAAEEAHLAADASADSPADGGDLLMDSLAGFEPGPGKAVIDPGTTVEETVSYNGIGSDPFRLFGVTRANPLPHAKDAVVRPSDSAPISPQPSPTGSGQASALPPVPHPTVGVAQSASPPAEQSPPADSNGSEESSSGSADTPQDAGTSEGADSVCLVVCVPPECANLPSTGVTTGYLVNCVTALTGPIDLVCNSYDSCRAFLIERLCPVSGVFCNIPPTAPTVVTRVAFDDVIGLPTSYAPGCGYAGFTAYDVNGRSVPYQPYTATATTEATLSPPKISSGTLDASGRAVLYYCPPAGVLTTPVEVTFTATVGVATGVAERSWTPNSVPAAPCLSPNAPTACTEPPPDCNLETNAVRCMVWTAVALQPPIMDVSIEDVTETTDGADGILAAIDGRAKCFTMHLRTRWAYVALLFTQTIAWANTRLNWCAEHVPDTGSIREIVEPTYTGNESWVWLPAKPWLDVIPMGDWDDCWSDYPPPYQNHCAAQEGNGLFQIEVGVGPSHAGFLACWAHWLLGYANGHGPKEGNWERLNGPCPG